MRRVLMGLLVAGLGGVFPLLCTAEGSELQEIVVTGSRIAGSGAKLARAVVMVDRLDLHRLGAESLGDALQQLPANTGSPPSTNFNAAQEDRGGDGSTRIDLRGLGPERTLVLVDGRRFVSGGLGGDTSVDLGMIPLSAVERVEVLGAGTAAVYGADAIGGVVNIITRQEVARPGEALVSGSLSSRGDGESNVAALNGSRIFEGGRIAGGVEWYSQSEVWMRDRVYSRNREVLMEDGSVIAFGLAQTPQGYFRIPPSNIIGLPAGTYTRDEGSGEPTGADDFRRFVEPDDRYNPNVDEYLRTPLDRWTLWLNGEHVLYGTTRLGISSMLHARRSSQLLRPAPIDTRFGIGIPVLANDRPGIPSDNYYNPFGVPMLDVRRRLVEAGRRRYEQDVEAARLVVTLGGKSVGGWTWEAAVGWSRNETNQVTSGELRSDRTSLALGASGVDDSGLPVCGTPDPATGKVAAADIIIGCVPMNLFGGQGADGLGTIDNRQLAYVTDRFRDQGRNEQWIVDAGARGELGELNAGPVAWAAGVEYRRESGFQRPDPDKLAGVSGSINSNLSEGASYAAYEAFGETRVPLLARRPAIERLDLDVGLRWSYFTSFGSTTNGSARLRWEPIKALSIRVGYSDVFRAPPISSLHSSTVRFLSIARDPCGNGPDLIQRTNCATNGVPGGSYVQPLFDQTPIVWGGSPDLGPESGQSWSTGLEWSAANGEISLALDYWNTAIRSAIRKLQNQTLLDECANTGAAQICGRITRESDGTVKVVDSRYLNLGSETASGVDVEARHRFDWLGGSANFRILATYLSDRSITTAPGSPSLKIAGAKFERSLYPSWRGLAIFDLIRGKWTAGYNAEYIDSVRECSTSDPLLPGMLTGCRQIAGVLYHDLRLGYVREGGWSVTLLVTNVTDVDPPRVAFGLGEGNTSAVTYRLLGRTFSIQLRYRTN